jgi:hypothetical protein
LPKVSLGATIPVAQYANLQPVIEAEGETIDEAMEIALGHIERLWNRTSSHHLDINRGQPSAPVGEILRCRVSDAEVIFDRVAHTYHDRQGNRYLGGSTFASQYIAPFAGEIIAGKMADKHGVEAQQILDMWALNAEASCTFGTAVHAALQLYGEYVELSKSVKDGSDESALTSNPVLRPIVEAFFTEEHKSERAYYEAFVADPATAPCGPNRPPGCRGRRPVGRRLQNQRLHRKVGNHTRAIQGRGTKHGPRGLLAPTQFLQPHPHGPWPECEGLANPPLDRHRMDHPPTPRGGPDAGLQPIELSAA